MLVTTSAIAHAAIRDAVGLYLSPKRPCMSAKVPTPDPMLTRACAKVFCGAVSKDHLR